MTESIFGGPPPARPQRERAEDQRLRACAAREPRADQWRRDYVQAVAQLRQDLVFPGAEAVFDTALTKGLLAVAAAERPDLLTPKNLPAASGLAKALAAVPEVDAPAAGEAYDRTSAVRHGRSPGGVLTPADLQLLENLDDHPALDVLHSELLDMHWAKVEVADRYEAARASAYLKLLDEDEIGRRVEAASELLAFVVPGEDVFEPQECPVCEHETMNREGGDDFGHGYTAGTCLVCSYRLSGDVAYERGMDAELSRQLAKD